MGDRNSFRIPFAVTVSSAAPFALPPLPPLKEPSLVFVNQATVVVAPEENLEKIPACATLYVNMKNCSRFALATLGASASCTASLRLNVEAGEVSSFELELPGGKKGGAAMQVMLTGEQWLVLTQEQMSALSSSN